MKYYLLIMLLLVLRTESFCQQMSNPDSVLAWLQRGNNSFVHGEFNVLGVDSSLRIELSNAQHPKAVILTCSDSRVAPELIFDKGLGDLFVIRVAGNISDDAVIGSIEYAVEHLHTPLVVVMGHKSCGAIAAAVADLQKPDNEIDNHIRILTDKIQQAISVVNLKEKDPVRNALISNIIFTVSSLNETRPVLSEAVKKGEIKIEGAVYDLTTGKVEWLSDKKY